MKIAANITPPKVVDVVTAVEAAKDKIESVFTTQKEDTTVSTAPAVPVTTAPPVVHAAWYTRAASWLLGVGKAIKAGVAKVVGEEPAIASAIAKVAPTVEALSNLVVPGSGSFEAHVLDVYGVVANGVKAAGDAVAANGISVTLDAALIAEIKQFLPQVEAFLHPSASAAAPTPTQ